MSFWICKYAYNHDMSVGRSRANRGHRPEIHHEHRPRDRVIVSNETRELQKEKPTIMISPLSLNPQPDNSHHHNPTDPQI